MSQRIRIGIHILRVLLALGAPALGGLRGLGVGDGGVVQVLPVLELLGDGAEAVADALDGVAAEHEAQGRVRAVGELPDQLGALDGARGLAVAEPLHHALRVQRGRRGVGVGLAGRLDEEVAPRRQGVRGDGRVRRLVAAHEARLDERRLDVEQVDLVRHGLDEALDGVLGRAVGAEPGHAEGAARRAEDEVAPRALRAEVRQRRLDDVQRAHEVGLELVPDLVLVLVLARPDHAVAAAVRDDVDAAEALERLLDDARHALPRAHVAQHAEAALRPPVHRLGRRLERAAHVRHEIVAGEGALHQ